MLLNLHVKNLALIDEADIYFNEGLNILTGETGAGKSILLGSVNLALGAKASKDIIGKHGDYASVELLFQVDDYCVAKLAEYDIEALDGQVLISRKFTESKNIMKINGDNVTLATVRAITPLLIDIHGQHEHQSLLYPANHLLILDRFAKAEISDIKAQLKEKYSDYQKLCVELDTYTMDEEDRIRTIDFLEYEINEIENARLVPSEDMELEAQYKRANNSQKIMTELSEVKECVGSDNNTSAIELVSRGYRTLMAAANYDEGLSDMVTQLADIESLLNDINRELSEYMSELEFDGESYVQLEERLDLINGLKAKHGGSIESIMSRLNEKQERLEFLKEYDLNRQRVLAKQSEIYNELIEMSDELNKLRQKAAKALETQIKEALTELNFLSVDFKIDFKKLDKPTANGMDYVEYLISVNPGESVKPLSKVASGGELSRIMLAIKTVLADKDEIGTLIFDEIDTGISGKTAQMVADKLRVIAANRQVICITHLPQIAAMADTHFEINKKIVDGKTVTSIAELSGEESIMELARLLGGMNITEAVISNAKELKALAKKA